MNLVRSSGILLHPTSLPSGRLGDDAYAFVDWLARAGQSWWQVLPLGPPDKLGSPYATSSAFAGWTGLLARPDARVTLDELEEYVARHAYWIGHWAAFAGVGAVAGQVRFDREWKQLREYAAARGVRIIGDIPIYVAEGGADHRAFPELFRSGSVAGVPPDEYSRNGQLWGNPLYDWTALRETGFRWWIERLRRTFELVDLTRIDHFRGFVAYWEVPAGRKTARRGRWRRAPGRELFEAARAELGDLPVIAEDLGVITPAVDGLRDELGFPGMVVIQWGFRPSGPHRLDAHRENQVAYTGTHDADTLVGWWKLRTKREQQRIREQIGSDDELHWALIRYVWSSRAWLAIAQMQDVLGLDNDARMNRPGTAFGNWRWRLRRGELTDELADRLREMTANANRV